MVPFLTFTRRAHFLAMLGIALLGQIACQNEELTLLNDSDTAVISTPEVIDGRLYFSSEESAIAFMQSRTKERPIEMILPYGFRSYRSAVKSAFREMDEFLNTSTLLSESDILAKLDTRFLYVDEVLNEVRPLIPDGPYSAMLNEAGEIQIGSHVHRYSHDVVQTLTKGAHGQLSVIREEPSSFVVLSSTDDAQGHPDSELHARAADCNVQMNNDSQRRMRGEFQKNNFGGWAEMRFVTKRQQQIFGTWHQRESQYLYVYGDPKAFRCVEQYWQSTGICTDDCYDCSHVDDASGYTAAAFCGDAGSGTHEASHHGSEVSCQTSR